MGDTGRAVQVFVTAWTGADGALTPTHNKPSFTPRRSGGWDESASYMTAELCACALARGPSRGTYREALLQTLKNKNSVKASFLTVDPVNYPIWNPGERVIIRNGERITC
jgi:hypothetical protein